jgi:hypothetical protein
MVAAAALRALRSDPSEREAVPTEAVDGVGGGSGHPEGLVGEAAGIVDDRGPLRTKPFHLGRGSKKEKKEEEKNRASRRRSAREGSRERERVGDSVNHLAL